MNLHSIYCSLCDNIQLLDIFSFLDSINIKYQRFDHPAVFTCQPVNELIPDLPGTKTKNLFLRDNKGKRHFLVSVPDHVTVDLKSLTLILKVDRLGMASSERLKKHLGLDPGSVSLLGVVNDSARSVEIIIDRELWKAHALQCHPLINTSTLEIAVSDMEKIFANSGHVPLVIEVPRQN